MAWTTTGNVVYFGYKNSFNSLRAVKHENATAIYDIVAYGTHLQPISEGVFISGQAMREEGSGLLHGGVCSSTHN